MGPNIREERRRIFRQELFRLKEEGYLSGALVEMVTNAHHQYHLDILKDETKLEEQTPEKGKTIKKTPPVKQKIVKKSLTAEEIRERNITWLLNIGVLFLLIGGLFVATSNWETMTSLMKSGSIAIVSFLFNGFAWLAKKILKIDKTAFAFTVLGSLFLPIFILSLGWFGLLGPYLSINGEGRFILGMLGSFIPILVYVIFAKTFPSRLFVWFAYISLAAGAAFTFAAMNLSLDTFYLGLMAFNGLLIIVYHRFKNQDSFKLFTKEFVPFIQANLVLSTLFMLFFYDDHVLYSLNLILTAVIYLSMIFVSGRKEYHFVFTAMIVYGAYQLIEHSILDSVGAIFYALIGFGFVFVPKAMFGHFSLEKVFQYTSGVISLFSFIYISLEGILLRAGDPSFILLIAYLIISANFLYLSYSNPLRFFPYLSSVFLASSIYEGVALIIEPFDKINFTLGLSFTGFALFILVGVFRLHSSLEIIQKSSRDVGIAISFGSVLLAVEFFAWWEVGVMLLLLSLMAYIVIKKEERIYIKEAARWVLPSAIGLSVVAFMEEIRSKNSFYHNEFGYGINFAAGALLVLLLSLGWKKYRENKLERYSLIVSQILYSFSIAHALLGPINLSWVQPLVLFTGIWMYYYLFKNIGTKWVPYLVSTATILFYFSIVHSVSLKLPFNLMVNSLIGSSSAVLLLVLSFIIRKYDSHLASAYAWVGHCIYPLSLLFTWFAFQTEAIYSLIIASIVYGASTRLSVTEWKVKVFLYGSFTALFLVISEGLNNAATQTPIHYEFLITSVLIGLFSFISNPGFKKRTAFYVIPFSMIGIGISLFTYPFETVPYLVICLYIAGTLLYLHLIKWDILAIIPLFFAFLATVEFSFFSKLDSFEKMLLAGGLGVLMLFIGQLVYKKLYEHASKIWLLKVDWYSSIAFLFFFFIYYFDTPQLWTDAIPGILIAVSIWMQRGRVPAENAVWMVIIGGMFLLQPYYALIYELNIPGLWVREVEVLPWLIVMIFVRLKLKGRFNAITKPLQWGVLILVSLLLIQDGLVSSTIYDAIILGSLSLVSMLSGMYFQIKSYFFMGAGVLLLNVLLQTRPYWGNMPWWGYLLIAGLILITVASTNEWNKQKAHKGESTFITRLKAKIINKLKKWD